ncbi:arginine-hydroxylase NDUFAF5, mitochondrial-like [Physella acuta]|uniref:arginine-hydroxylase NDUFAF5, mitochondrial-like n=1 Tax=Physella acuta TaxID=109671 RepID=UPI0027DE310D|nr:arginine-hydroxylase NDUFAF5, mitochondrial-like [Physella acuta]
MSKLLTKAAVACSRLLQTGSLGSGFTDALVVRCLNTQQEVLMNVFDRKAKLLQRERAAQGINGEDVSVYDYVKDEFGYRTAERIWDIKRRFGVVVDLGSGRGHVTKHICKDSVDLIYQCEFSPSLLDQAAVSPEVTTKKMVVDEENLPFEENSIDMFISSLSLHWVNDLPGCLSQILRALKNDCCIIGCMFGGDTLYQLRVSLQLAEIEREGGFAPHISPFTTANDLGSLLTRTGFTLLTIDMDEMTITYPSIFELMYDLKGMGENNCTWRRKPQLHRDTMLAAASIYKEMYGNDKGIPATFQVINFIAWKPDPSQPKPAKRGSGQVSLKDLDKLDQLAKQMTMKQAEIDGVKVVKLEAGEHDETKHDDTDPSKGKGQ